MLSDELELLCLWSNKNALEYYAYQIPTLNRGLIMTRKDPLLRVTDSNIPAGNIIWPDLAFPFSPWCNNIHKGYPKGRTSISDASLHPAFVLCDWSICSTKSWGHKDNGTKMPFDTTHPNRVTVGLVHLSGTATPILDKDAGHLEAFRQSHALGLKPVGNPARSLYKESVRLKWAEECERGRWPRCNLYTDIVHEGLILISPPVLSGEALSVRADDRISFAFRTLHAWYFCTGPPRNSEGPKILPRMIRIAMNLEDKARGLTKAIRNKALTIAVRPCPWGESGNYDDVVQSWLNKGGENTTSDSDSE